MTIEFKAKGTRGEIWLYDAIGGGGFFSEGISAKQFAKELTAFGKVNTINLRINSPGGDVFDGLSIYNLLANHPAQITVDIDGLAASIASVIAMAGDEINIAANAMVMIHDPQGVAVGSSSEMQRMAALLDQIKGNLADTYAGRTGSARADLEQWMADETWFTAEAAVERGFANRITSEQQVTAYFDVSNFRNVPEALKRRLANQRTPAADITRVRIHEQERRLIRA